ncbi:hypothetical protein [Castellaniella caeni]|uniref:hypothetical protein n=1 Tax=Castellaniella caeni TaxID=266123 RepID=UPI0009FCED56|nr:hypothetical protein [Castellaniella caeni]
MLPVLLAPEPKTFDQKVRQPGLRAIAEMVGKPPPYPRMSGKPYQQIACTEADIPPESLPSYWTEALDDLMSAYHEVCAYSCFRIHPVTGARSADHFAPKSRNWRAAYEWSNYRLCCSRLNARKNNLSTVLDPFEIGNEYFALELVGFQVIPGRAVVNTDAELRVRGTIARLGLNDFRHQRAQDAECYWDRDYSLKALKRESPFVAYELHRQGRLNPGDIW